MINDQQSTENPIQRLTKLGLAPISGYDNINCNSYWQFARPIKDTDHDM
jgi:hypothetical protein